MIHKYYFYYSTVCARLVVCCKNQTCDFFYQRRLTNLFVYVESRYCSCRFGAKPKDSLRRWTRNTIADG